MKGINHKYIVLQQPKLKVRLLAGSEFWNVVVAGVQYNITIWMEALFASLIYDPNNDSKTEIMKYIASRYNKSATPVHAEKFITLFKAEHPVEQLQVCDLSDIQLLNTEDDGCAIPIYKYDCAIISSEEESLVKQIQVQSKEAWHKIYAYFYKYLEQYGQCFYPKLGTINEAAIVQNNFFRIHGLPVSMCHKPSLTMKERKRNIAKMLLLWSVLCFVVFLMCLDAHTGDSPKGIVGCIAIAGFFSCILGAIYQYRKKHVITKWLLSHRIVLAIIILCIGIGSIIFIKWATYSPPSPSEQMRLEREYDESIKDAQYPWRQWQNFDLNSITDKATAKSMLRHSTLLPENDKWYEEKLIDQHFNCQ